MENQENMPQRFIGRSQAREEAFKLLFQSSVCKDNMGELFEYFLNENPDMQKYIEYIRGVVLGVLEKKDEIDDIISGSLRKGWKISRIAKVSFYALELAVYEMKYVDDVPEKTAINEAINLVKKYSDTKNASFVNGVLSGVYKQLYE